MLEKNFLTGEIEARLYQGWEEGGFFKAGRKPKAEPYTIVMPPPNITGSLHMGHALDITLQDILIRFQRMRGRDVLWQPGTDHAGIATQMVVERLLLKEGKTDRRQMGRAAFIDRIWQWKKESGGIIASQLRRLGASCDWSRERFTLDEGLSKAVCKVFVALFKQGLIYKDKRLVNWDPKFQTALSDLEVENIEVRGNLWHIAYPIEGENDATIIVATTRPETMLGDVAIAVHPDNSDLKHLIGKRGRVPLLGRLIPIIGDDYADPEKGTGAVKITPAHDFNDFEVAKRHKLPLINILDQFGNLSLRGDDFLGGVSFANVPQMVASLDGVERFAARKQLVAELEVQGFLVKVEACLHQVPHDEKTKNVVIEPFLTEQWYVNAAVLAKPAIAVVEKGETDFIPKNWQKTYFEWMHNIQPWCISRQLWWGHQIPAWYGPDDKVFVEESEQEAAHAAFMHYGETVTLRRDEDVLDTWFSSALWPFSTLGWPEKTPELKRHYKTDLLVSGFDIIFFWVARMMMMGLHFMGEVPFRSVYLHALIRDEKGQKMSKSKGNVMDPLELIDLYGADALRFTLAIMAAQGRDIKLAKSRVEGYRNFATKLWNATRFAQNNGVERVEAFDPVAARIAVNRWIIGEVARAQSAVVAALEAYKFNEAASILYHLIWNIVCDWYLELVKPILNGQDAAGISETRATIGWMLDQIFIVLHPFMPFLTEELWQKTAKRETWLIDTSWPTYQGLGDAHADAEMEWVIKLISEIRSVRIEMNIPAARQISCIIVAADQETRRRLAQWEHEIRRLTRLDTIHFEEAVPRGSAQIILGEAILALPLQGLIDFDVERARLMKEKEKVAKEMAVLQARLQNESFRQKARAEVLEESQNRWHELENLQCKLSDALGRLN